MMDEKITRALAEGGTIDITTTGRQTGQPRRIEIWFHNVDGHVYITGRPGKRSWYANLLANPALTFHLKEGVQADLPAHATPITDSDSRRAIMGAVLKKLGRSSEEELDQWVQLSPLVKITFDES
jgi:deazaflavin-dependent oxidoreductase (nitroreductase family)